MYHWSNHNYSTALKYGVHAHLMKDILIIECVQHHVYSMIMPCICYKTRLIKLKLFPLIYLFDILFAIKSINTPTIQFNIINYINFSSVSTRSGANNKLILPQHLNNTSRHSYFHWLPSLWNSMPIFDLDMTFNKLKSKLKQ